MSSSDLFNRRERAARLVNDIDSRNKEKPEVIGVVGVWGSGKSTFLDYMRDVLKDSHTDTISMAFHPWWLASRSELLSRFFIDMGATLGDTPNDTGASDNLRRFGKAFTVGASLARLIGSSLFMDGDTW